MQLSKQGVDQLIEKQMMDWFYQLLADLHTTAEVAKSLAAILTDVELTTIAKRIAIAYFLDQGKSYGQIRDELKVSSATIATIQAKLTTDEGLALALKKIKADQWAGKLTRRLMGWLGVG